MKVIYIFERRHGYVHDIKSFQMDSFLSKGYKVEVWSAVNWKIPDIPEPLGIDKSGRTRYINDKRSLMREIERVKGEQCIFLIYPYHDYDYIAYIIRKNIKKSGFEFCNIAETPSPHRKTRLICSYSKYFICFKELNRTLRELAKIFLKDSISKLECPMKYIKAAKNLYARIWGPMRYKSLYNFVTLEMLYDYYPNYLEIFSKRNILIHSDAYDEYLETKDLPSLYEKEYIVYIDSYEIGHSDYIKSGLPFPVSDVGKHLDRINTLFDEIETAMGCKVIIAAHPKAEYKGDEFAGREIVYYKTDHLIKDARFVIIGGPTTCIGTMVMYEKNYLVIYSSEYFENLPYKEEDYQIVKEWLNCDILDIRNPEHVKRWKSYFVNYRKNVGDNYKRQFVISENGIRNKKKYDVIADMVIKNQISGE